MIFPISKSCYKIIDYVYSTNGVKISRLLKDTSVSQKIGYQHIDELINNEVFINQNNGSLRIIKPNLLSETGRLMFGLIEKDRELRLINKKPDLKQSIKKLKENAYKFNIKSAVLFGSFVKKLDGEKIDILIISENNDKKIIDFLKECFSNVENAVSARILSIDGFKKFKNNKQDLFNELFRNHVCVYNAPLFINLIA